MEKKLVQVILMLTEEQRNSLDMAAALDGRGKDRRGWLNQCLKQGMETMCQEDRYKPFRDQLVSVWE